ncbi:MAG: hypothetical protein JGK17_30320 [Microcoleus sp. PH2017_10_PVI_O_A]|uniref:hypothetical protein n=1 Tax=unclassified Microcoleus TaxID=2642155 RepID=UPI001D68C60C|nr:MULTISPECIES: hypothetical protein [unclassified Microcoleus]MCC3409768.1 hypothetical protein [Microcoleus sp. PH2017_10_PVI_O_A]MCC3464032.1 hypothetical protein [Microcoleus sp. PH2017_11_PCY_U_A]MCC3482373.1 hypothetical protein [Microcoleus sp. PH2017_12_PCY_D_A]MCC3528146.1 hypothetical protein [Microcoleus sp. PH2017_21_RUC_O_A]MCC3542350.1 hypothetical protein [Microcoleus sp. PH2017_22_RUC_O_B]
MELLTAAIDSMSGSGAIVSQERSRLKSKASVTFLCAQKYSGDRPIRYILISFG